jgi:hypothetical protein
MLLPPKHNCLSQDALDDNVYKVVILYEHVYFNAFKPTVFYYKRKNTAIFLHTFKTCLCGFLKISCNFGKSIFIGQT